VAANQSAPIESSSNPQDDGARPCEEDGDAIALQLDPGRLRIGRESIVLRREHDLGAPDLRRDLAAADRAPSGQADNDVETVAASLSTHDYGASVDGNRIAGARVICAQRGMRPA
jgi:hypothetical protein